MKEGAGNLHTGQLKICTFSKPYFAFKKKKKGASRIGEPRLGYQDRFTGSLQ